METAQNRIGITHRSKPVSCMQAKRVPGLILTDQSVLQV